MRSFLLTSSLVIAFPLSALASAHAAQSVLLTPGCDCEGAGDCTCKKGACKCSKCGDHGAKSLAPSLSGQRQPLPAPKTARQDASAGMFI